MRILAGSYDCVRTEKQPYELADGFSEGGSKIIINLVRAVNFYYGSEKIIVFIVFSWMSLRVGLFLLEEFALRLLIHNRRLN